MLEVLEHHNQLINLVCTEYERARQAIGAPISMDVDQDVCRMHINADYVICEVKTSDRTVTRYYTDDRR